MKSVLQKIVKERANYESKKSRLPTLLKTAIFFTAFVILYLSNERILAIISF